MELLLQPLAMQCAGCREERGGGKSFVIFEDIKMEKRKMFCSGDPVLAAQNSSPIV